QNRKVREAIPIIQMIVGEQVKLTAVASRRRYVVQCARREEITPMQEDPWRESDQRRDRDESSLLDGARQPSGPNPGNDADQRAMDDDEHRVEGLEADQGRVHETESSGAEN